MDHSSNVRTAISISDVKVSLQRFGLPGVFIALCIFLTATSDSFLTVSNFFNVARQVSLIGIIGVGMFFVLVGGGIDISVGSLVALIGVVMAGLVVKSHLSVLLAVGLSLLLAATLGFINAYFVTKWRIPPFIVTLGMMSAARGFAFVYTNGYAVFGLPEGFKELGRGYIGSVPIPVIIMLAIVLLAHFAATKTKFGRFVYAIGGNEEAARLSGINVAFYRGATYVLCSMLAGVSGIILTSRLASGQPNSGVGYEFEAITAAVLGGTSLFGGEGTIWGVIFGALFMGVLGNGLNLLNVSSYWQLVIKGAVLVVAVLIDMLKKR
ncbi:MAG: ABC transporter permease [Firmicutes bacterium]|nr:ABC transporter permease [Bacillota bacterium]